MKDESRRLIMNNIIKAINANEEVVVEITYCVE